MLGPPMVMVWQRSPRRLIRIVDIPGLEVAHGVGHVTIPKNPKWTMEGLGVIRRFIRTCLERSPAIAAALRAARDELQWRTDKPTRTPYGFLFSGNPAMQNGVFEPEEIALILRLLPNFDTLIDVGANIGLYTCLALQNGKEAIAFEPLQANVRTLCRNLEANSWTTEVWPVGLSDAPGISFLYGGNTGASLLPGWAGVAESWRQPVPLNTLDSIVGHRIDGKRFLVKVDVEGAELGVIRGAGQLLDRNAIWLVEITLDVHREIPNPDFLETFETFWRHGYNSFTADMVGRPVARQDVLRWIEFGAIEREFGCGNWLFTAP